MPKFDQAVFGRRSVNPIIQYSWYEYFSSFEAGNCFSNSIFEWTKNIIKQFSRNRANVTSGLVVAGRLYSQVLLYGTNGYLNDIVIQVTL